MSFVKTKYMKILLEQIMDKKNITIRQVSLMTGVPRSTISDILNGRTMPRLDTMEQLAVGLKVSINDLFDKIIFIGANFFSLTFYDLLLSS